MSLSREGEHWNRLKLAALASDGPDAAIELSWGNRSMPDRVAAMSNQLEFLASR